MQVGHQLPPGLLGRMFLHGQFLPVFRAGKTCSLGVADRHINLASRHVQMSPLDPPGVIHPRKRIGKTSGEVKTCQST